MSELINKNDNRTTIRWKLLTGTSTLALAICVSSANVARAEDANRPLLWIDLGGQMEMLQGTSSEFRAPFMAVTPEPDSYSDDIFSKDQKPPRFAFGFEGSLKFQPEDSDWNVSAAIRYGRSNVLHHCHQQGPIHSGYAIIRGVPLTQVLVPIYAAAFGDAKMHATENHMILDFSAGKDVGLGVLGQSSLSSINAGVRFAQFSTDSEINNSARPSVTAAHVALNPVVRLPRAQFHQYTQMAHAERNFHGAGPSISWTASAPVAGNAESSELTIDWGINAALLFGRQKAKTNHHTQAYALTEYHCSRFRTNGACAAALQPGYPQLYTPRENHSTRSRNVTVPNIGAFASLSLKWPNAKVSLGYRVDDFLNAMDTGIDARKSSNVLFHGPFASISIGLGD